MPDNEGNVGHIAGGGGGCDRGLAPLMPGGDGECTLAGSMSGASGSWLCRAASIEATVLGGGGCSGVVV